MKKIHKAMVLAAGFGQRARPLSLVRPKPLFPVLNRPLLSRALDALRRAGIKEAVVNTHHLAGRIREYLSKTGHGLDVHILEEKKEILGTGGGVGNAAGFLRDGPFILLNSDVWTDFPLEEAVEIHRRLRPLATLVMHDCPDFNQVAVGGDGLIRGFRGRFRNDGGLVKTLAFTGIHVVDPEVFRFIPPGPGDIIAVYQSIIEAGLPIAAHVADRLSWWDAGTLSRYLDLHAWLLARHPEGPVMTGQGVRLGRGCRIEGWACLGDGVEIGEGAVIRDSVLWPGAAVSPGVAMTRCVAADGARVTHDVQNLAVTGGTEA